VRRLAILSALLAAAVLADAPRPAFIVIVNPHTQVARVDRKFLAEVFFRRATRWPDDTPIHPVDLGPDSPARIRFSLDVLARSVSAVRSFWQQRIFSGQGLPPPELADDSEVVTYVAGHPGAIGYVSYGARIEGARAVEVDWSGM
jgi:ABC-type phosphate transport system substrate-binding protein